MIVLARRSPLRGGRDAMLRFCFWIWTASSTSTIPWGKGESAKCNVSALRVTLFGSKLHIDCQHVIEWVSEPLPEGVYELSIEGKAITMRHSKDGWQVVLAGK